MPGKFIHIRSSKFPILSGEDDEIVNEGMYGKALAEYLQVQLGAKSYEVPFHSAEDWGWWVELAGEPFKFGVCIHSAAPYGKGDEFVCTEGSLKPRHWRWSKFRFVDKTDAAEKLERELIEIFESDNDIRIIGITDEFPF
jgi:hypothetical protein